MLIGIGGPQPALIYGDFGEEYLAVNGGFYVCGASKFYGDFEVNGAFFGGSSKYIKQDFENIQAQKILDKVSTLPITTWAYIDKPDVRHIGPMAQDLHAAFGFGKDDVTIATVDADGVALASIQALYELLLEERKRNDQLEEKVDLLIERMLEDSE